MSRPNSNCPVSFAPLTDQRPSLFPRAHLHSPSIGFLAYLPTGPARLVEIRMMGRVQWVLGELSELLD